MTKKASVIGLFCEDIRTEQGGQNSLVGILPDNLNVSQLPAMIPKLCLYVRFSFPSDSDPGPLSSRLVFPDGTEHKHPVDSAVVEKAKKEALEKGNPIAGIIARAQFMPVPINEPVRLTLYATLENEERVCGVLNIGLAEKAPETS